MAIKVEKYKHSPKMRKVMENNKSVEGWDKMTQGSAPYSKEQGCTPLSLHKSNFGS
jgi:hypothetical protein